MKSQSFRKPHKVKRKKPFFRNRFFWVALLILITFGALFYLFFFFSFFQTKEIKISGNQKIKTSDLEKEINPLTVKKFWNISTRSIFLISSSRIKTELLKNFPLIGSINIHKKFPDSLILEIEERKPVADFCLDSLCFLADQKGIIFENSDGVSKNFIKIRDTQQKPVPSLGEKVVDENVLNFALKVKTKLEERLKIDAEEFTLISPERLNLKTSEGWEIFFDLKSDLTWQIEKLILVLESEIPPKKRGNLEYIDLRFSRVYYKYR
jgi:cell division septal protein FtsQ